MLGRLKNAAKSWIAGIFIGLLVLSFAVWGIGDIFLGTTNTNVAEVGGVPISAVDFERRFRSQVQELSFQTDGVFDTLQARRLGLDQQVLITMIQSTAFDVAARKLGLTASDKALLQSIQSNEAFAGMTGRFSENAYKELLLQNGFTPQMYEDALRKDLARVQLLDTVVAGPVASRRMAEAVFSYRTERRVIDYLVIPPETVGQLSEPTRTELKEYHKTNAVQFTAPEFRSFTYILVESDDFRDQVEVSKDDIKAQYEFNKARFTVPERRTVEVIYFDSEDAVRQAQEDLAGGLSFDELVASRNLSLDEIRRVDVAQAEMIDEPLAEAAFQLPLGQTSNAIRGVVNWALIRVTNISSGREQPYEEAQEIIRDEMVGQLATNALFEFSNEIEDGLAGGATIEETASALGIETLAIRSVSRNGRNADNAQPLQLPANDTTLDMVLTEAFRNDIGFEGDLLSTEQDGYFVLRVDDVTPSALKSFDSVIEAVRTSFLKTKRSKKLGEIAESIGERAKGGSTFEALANEIGRTILSTTPDIGRGDNDETFSLQLISKAFAANIDDFVNGPTSFGESWIVATPRKSIKQSLAMNAAQVEALMEQLGQSTLQDLLDQYYTALGDRLGVKTYPNVIDTTLGVVAE